MRFATRATVSSALALMLGATSARAGEGEPGPIGVELFGGAVYGPGQGSDQESTCGADASCSERKRPFGASAGARMDYKVQPKLRIGLEFGRFGFKSSLTRAVKLRGESSTLVDVKATDDTELSAYLLAVGAHYAVIEQPVVLSVGVALGGLLGGEAQLKRGGHATCLTATLTPTGETDCSTATVGAEPTERPMKSVSDTATLGFTLAVLPEVRASVPIGSMFAVGVGLGAVFGFASVKPTKPFRQTPSGSPNDAAQPLTPDGRTVGFITTNDQWVGTFILPRATLFVRAAF